MTHDDDREQRDGSLGARMAMTPARRDGRQPSWRDLLRPRPTPPGAAQSLFVALLLASLATLLGALLRPHLDSTPLSPFYSAVAIAAWYGGLRTGIPVAVLSLAGAIYFVIEPVHTFPVDDEELPSLVAFLFVSFVLSALAEQSRRAAARARVAEGRLQVLAEAGEIFASSLDYERTLGQVTSMVVPRLADWCTVNLLHDDGSIERIAATHVDPQGQRAFDELKRDFPIDPAGTHPVARAIRAGEFERFTGVGDTFRPEVLQDDAYFRLAQALGTENSLMVPMTARGRTLGAIGFGRTAERTTFDQDDVALAEQLARRAALAIDNARLYLSAQAAEAYYRTLFEGSDDAIVVGDGDGSYLDVNPAAELLTGYSRAELLQPGMATIVDRHAEERASSDGPVDASDDDGAVFRGEVMVSRKDGSCVPVEARAVQLALPSGRVVVGAWRDISERRHLERLQQEFIVMVTHDLKTPLTSIRGLAQLMRRRGRAEPRQLDHIIAQSTHLERLINDLLDVARLAGGRADLDRSPVDLVELASRCVEQVQATTTHPLRLEVDGAPLVGAWDADRVRQVIDNLLGNAVKYSPNGGEITVRVWREDGEARLAVADHGIGISPEALPRLFERFYRVEETLSGGEGLGLGLHIARELVDAHGGRIWAESVPGQGSVFTLALPLPLQQD